MQYDSPSPLSNISQSMGSLDLNPKKLHPYSIIFYHIIVYIPMKSAYVLVLEKYPDGQLQLGRSRE